MFNSFTEQTQADGEPRGERLAAWFAARPAAVLVLAAGAVIIAAGLAFLASQPGPCRSGAYNPSGHAPPRVGVDRRLPGCHTPLVASGDGERELARADGGGAVPFSWHRVRAGVRRRPAR